jgi:hypothetical protein
MESKKVKAIEDLSIACDPDKIAIGLNTTVQDLVDIINHMRVELLIKDAIISNLEHHMRPVPDNVISIEKDGES